MDSMAAFSLLTLVHPPGMSFVGVTLLKVNPILKLVAVDGGVGTPQTKWRFNRFS
jgi:hypothetical protein